MGFLDSLEKLITEHGSAAILKERIGLLNDRHADLEKRAENLQTDNDRLKRENEVLLERVRALEASAAAASVAPLAEPAEKILVALSQRPGMTQMEIARAVQEHEQIVEFYLTEFYNRDFCGFSGSYVTGRQEWELGHEGRRYLMQRGLLK